MRSSAQPIQRGLGSKAGLTQQAPFLVRLLVSTREEFYLQRRSTGDTQIALTDTREGEVVFLSSRHTVRRMNLYLASEVAGGLAAQLFERNAVVLVPIRQRFIQLNPHSKEDHKLGARRNRKFQHVENGLYDQRDQSARERGYSSSGETKSSLLLTEPSVRGPSSTCYEAPVFGGSPLLDLERRTSGQRERSARARLGLVISKTNEKRSGSIGGGGRAVPQKGKPRSNSNWEISRGLLPVYQIEDDRGPTIVALHKTVPFHFEFLPS
ncbi:hypothetical protein HAX54_044127 [Datura stramonium]|uniref:Uncharacterized protein n=1 Tax=Datura stramonium TaxID=4076 RepID=A0ABS8W264_DATST|nr:hypothetical protein [Datura stramonium]